MRINSRMLMASLAVSVSVAACSSSYTYDFSIEIAEDVVLDDDPPLRFVASSSDSLADTDEESGDRDFTKAAPRTYTGEAATCCAPSETLYMFAFLDLDRNGRWDEGEPWGEDPNNPVKIDEDGYKSEIVVEPDV